MMLIGGSVMFLILVVLIIFILTSCIRIVPQAQALVVERLGGYLGTYGVGIHFMVPFIDRVAKKVNLKEQVEDFPPQPVITKDNVTMQIDTVVFFYITDPKSYAYGVERPILAIENLTATTLRNIIGELELDETLTSRETINAKMQESLDIATDPWGIKVTRVELKNIEPRSDISHHAGRSHLYFPGRFPWRSQPNRIIDSHLDLLFDRRLSLQDQVGRYRGANRP